MPAEHPRVRGPLLYGPMVRALGSPGENRCGAGIFHEMSEESHFRTGIQEAQTNAGQGDAHATTPPPVDRVVIEAALREDALTDQELARTTTCGLGGIDNAITVNTITVSAVISSETAPHRRGFHPGSSSWEGPAWVSARLARTKAARSTSGLSTSSSAATDTAFTPSVESVLRRNVESRHKGVSPHESANVVGRRPGNATRRSQPNI